MITNVVLVVGVLMTLFDDFVVLCIGKLLYGAATGAFIVYCPKYISETTPVEVRGPAGGLT